MMMWGGAGGHSEDDPGHSCPCLWLAGALCIPRAAALGKKFGVHCSQPTSEPPPGPSHKAQPSSLFNIQLKLYIPCLNTSVPSHRFCYSPKIKIFWYCK